MPEGDSVWRAATSLNTALAGREITKWSMRWPTLSTTDLSGHETLEVVSVGKHILHRVSGGFTLHSHLRMDGSWRVYDQMRKPRITHETRAVVGTENASCVGQLLGELDLLQTQDEHEVIGHLGPDLLSQGWDANEALRLLRESQSHEIGSALLDQRILAGLGTIWVSETLFAAKVNPWQFAASLSDKEACAVFDHAHRILNANKLARPDSRKDPRIDGIGKFVYGRAGKGCLRCRGEVARSTIGEPLLKRNLYWCRRCQPK
jgi:endonuclease-8